MSQNRMRIVEAQHMRFQKETRIYQEIGQMLFVWCSDRESARIICMPWELEWSWIWKLKVNIFYRRNFKAKENPSWGIIIVHSSSSIPWKRTNRQKNWKCMLFVQLAISAQSEKEAAVCRVKPPAQRRTEGRLSFGGKISSIKVSNLWNFQFIWKESV